eukprot:3856282-Lingulodinium_polyedra.AAC.1
MAVKTPAMGPPLARALALAPTAAMAARHHGSATVPARSARTAIMIGPSAATAAGSRRHAGLSKPNTTSAAKRPVPCIAADLAARRKPRSSAAGGAPQAAPYIPAPVPAAAPI